MLTQHNNILMHRNTSGHLEQHRTGHHLQMWQNQHMHMTSKTRQVLPDTQLTVDLPTKFEWPGGIPSKWAPIPKT